MRLKGGKKGGNLRGIWEKMRGYEAGFLLRESWDLGRGRQRLNFSPLSPPYPPSHFYTLYLSTCNHCTIYKRPEASRRDSSVCLDTSDAMDLARTFEERRWTREYEVSRFEGSRMPGDAGSVIVGFNDAGPTCTRCFYLTSVHSFDMITD